MNSPEMARKHDCLHSHDEGKGRQTTNFEFFFRAPNRRRPWSSGARAIGRTGYFLIGVNTGAGSTNILSQRGRDG